MSIDINILKILKSITKYCKNITHFSLIRNDYRNFDKILESLFIKNANIRKIHLDSLYLSGTFFSKLKPNAIEELIIINCIFNSNI